MISFLFQSLLILTLFYGVYRIFLKRMTFFSDNRYFLLTGMLLALIVPLLPLDFSTVRTEFIYVDPEILALSQARAGEQTASATLPSSMDWAAVLMGIYAAGVLAGGVFLMVRLFKILQIIGKGRKIKKQGFSLVHTDEKISPFSFFNYIVINPLMHAKEDLSYILVHEEVHAKQFHQADLMLSEILKILLWFYPPAYAYQKSVKNNLEYLTDRHSLQKGLDRKDYQLLLINVSGHTVNESLVNNFSKKLIKERIKMIHKNQTATAHKRIYIPLMLLLGLLCIGVGVSAQSDKKIETKVIVKEAESLETGTEPETLSAPEENKLRMEYTFDEDPKSDEIYDAMSAVLPTGPNSDSIDLKNVSEIIMKDVNGAEIWIVRYKDGLKIDTLYTKDPNSPSARFMKYRDLLGVAPDIDFEELKKLSPKGIDAQKLFEENKEEFQKLFQSFPKGKDGSFLIQSDSVKLKKVKIKDYKTGKKNKFSLSPSIVVMSPEAALEEKRPIIIKDGKELTWGEIMNLKSSKGVTVVRQSWEEFKNSDITAKKDSLIIVLPKSEQN